MTELTHGITIACMVAGTVFALIGAVGVARLPDLLTRMQASTKSATLGVGFTILATMIYFGNLGVAARGSLVIAFLFLTAPVAAHMIGRAGYYGGVSLWEGTIVDELKQELAPEGSMTPPEEGDRSRGESREGAEGPGEG